MNSENIILAPTFFDSSLLAKVDRFAGHAIAVCARWAAARRKARRSCRVSRVHTSSLAHGLRLAPTGHVDREHGRGPTPCNGIDSSLVSRRGDAP